MKNRLPAEWEKQRAIMVVFPTNQKDWQHSIKEIQQSYIDFINTLRHYQSCHIICEDLQAIQDNFPDMHNICVHKIQTNDTWIRDFGAIEYYDKNNKLQAYDFSFNAWGAKYESNLDNSVNENLLRNEFFKNLNTIDFILEGGSIDTNGQGVMLSTSKCLFNTNRNFKLSRKQIEKKLENLFGIHKLIILENGALLGDDTDAHIDTLARFIDENTIAYLTCKDKKDPHFESLQKMEKELQQTGFELLALPLPKAKFFKQRRLPATYINFVFINNALIVPTYNDANDQVVIETLQKYLPSIEIRGVDASIFIRENGSLHCSCMNYFQIK